MLVTQQPVLRRFWYAVMPVSLLDDGPKPFTLLGENIVIWKSSTGELSCLKDRCCHRTAKLSLGFVENDNIVCGYHGWTFDGAGACVRIPQRPGEPISAKTCVPSYRVAEKYGYVWVALDDPLTDIPHIAAHDRPGFRRVPEFYEPWKIGALRLMENSFDWAHVAYVHRGTFGSESRPEVDSREVVTNAYGFVTTTAIPVVVSEDAQKAVGTTDAESVRHIEATWFMPFARSLAIRYPHGLEQTLITCATPIDDDTCMICQWVYRNDTEEQVSAADVIAFDRAVTAEDKLILESCDADVPLSTQDGEEMHMPSDRPGIVMRRMLGKLLKEHGQAEQRRQESKVA
ncbi:3-phenylpropionate dioxygenase [Pigmentiphaga litoralis]|uniref:aromatic ring-hydroxylating dioxygenase subunit alpha n=1 Tax=Pigmentiphaga litoralis TaxID=516702 RepID=UPI00167B85FC|nr:aromatic ring-hydroxylating dioxygenase subunit alpha [Pigmentiphaga litoralis]GGX15064.1 3-phenylpropionate dioxygenase [Pigmentiphaga litoralis]